MPATCALACERSTATLCTVACLNRLLGYASSHRDGCRIYMPSDMLLRLFSDASYLSRPNAGSVSGSFHYLGRYDKPTFINAPISCSSYRIPVICSSVQEAEYGGLFATAKIALEERRILCDSEFAVGLAHRILTSKLSKRIDMRFYWLQDRARQRKLCVQHVPSVLNQSVCALHCLRFHERSEAGFTSYYCLYMIFATVCFYTFSVMVIASGCIHIVIILLPILSLSSCYSTSMVRKLL
jgi:hypothetical protein